MNPDIKNLHKLRKRAAVLRMHKEIQRSLAIWTAVANGSYGRDLGVSAYPAPTPLTWYQRLRQSFRG